MTPLARKTPRRPTIAQATLASEAGPFEGVITDLSADGAFIRTATKLADGERLQLEIELPTGGKKIAVGARVVRVGTGGGGVRFEDLPARDRSRLRSYAGYYQTDETIVHLQRLLGRDLPSNLLPLGDQEEISAIIHQAVDLNCEVTVFEELGSSPERQACVIEKIDTEARVMDFDVGIIHLSRLERPLSPSTRVLYFVFSFGELFYASEALVLSGGDEPTLLLPERIYLSERRSQPREARNGASSIHFPSGFSSERLTLPVADLTDRGASLNLPKGSLVVPGMRFPSFKLRDGEKTHSIPGATVRYVTSSSAEDIRVGLSFEAVDDQDRDTAAETMVRTADRRVGRRIGRMVSAVSGRLALFLGRKSEAADDGLEVVRYKNDRGDMVAGLLDSNFDTQDLSAEIDVAVVVAPAILKRKEVFALLSRTIVDNLTKLGKRGVVLRFDATHVVGESTMDPKRVAEDRPYYDWTLDNMRSDIEASLGYLEKRFSPQSKALVSVSLSSIPSRKVVLKDLVDLWIAPFGCPDAQDMFRNYLAGLELFEEYARGEGPESIMIHGRPIKGSSLYGQALESKMAFLEDAREDLGRIRIPVTWILGRFDHWVTRSRVRAMLDAPGGGVREIFEFPTGHVVKEGPEAIEVAKVVSETVAKHLFGEDRPAVDPNLGVLTQQSNLEWSRVGRLKLDDRKQFWHDHLFGGPSDGIGYDIMLSHPEYSEFIREQVALLEARAGHDVADFGCGTGNLTVALAKEGSKDGPLGSLTYADVVPAAVERTAEKLDQQLESELAHVECRGLEIDFEELRMAPIRDFVEGRLFGVTELIGRIEGLEATTANKLRDSYGRELHATLRGKKTTAERVKALCPGLTDAECEVVLEISRASRWVQAASGNGAGHKPADAADFKHLDFGPARAVPELDFPSESFDRIGASLLLPYLHEAAGFLAEVRRLLRPDGVAVISSVLSNFDPSQIYSEAAQYVQEGVDDSGESEKLLSTLRYFGNSVSRVVELEEDGRFHFHSPVELENLAREAGFAEVSVTPAFGRPPAALILRAIKR